MRLDGNAAVVTGGASGLGGATAAALARGGAYVTILDRDAARGAAQAAAIGALFIETDVTDDSSVAAALTEAEAAHGTARILVNCAGIAPAARTVGRDGPHALDLYRRVIEVNLIGTFNVLSKFAHRLAAAQPLDGERGVIVNTASVASTDGQVGQAAYASSKAGVVGLTLPVARDLASLAIRCVAIEPGLFLTPMLEGLPAEVQDSLGKQVPFPNRLGRPDEYAQLVLHILANPMLNGTSIRLDGAIRMAPR